MKKLSFVLLGIILVAALAGAFAGCASEKEKPVLRFGHFGVNNNMDLIVAHELGLYDKHGVIVELPMMGTGDIVPAMVGGHLDGGLGAAAYVIQTITEGFDAKLVASASRWERPQQLPYIVVLKDSPIQTVQDLDGKTISAGQKGSCTWYHVNAVQRDYGIEFSQYIEAPSAGQYIPMLFANKVDATVMFGTQRLVTNKDKIREIAPLNGEAIIGCTASFLWFRTDYLEENPEAVEGFIDALQEAREYIKANPEEGLKLFVESDLSRSNSLGDSLNYLEQGMLWDFPDEMLVEVWQMKNAQDLILELGLIDEPIDLEKYVDTRFAEPVWDMPPGELDWLPKP